MKRILFSTIAFAFSFSVMRFVHGDFELGGIFLAIAFVALVLSLGKGEG